MKNADAGLPPSRGRQRVIRGHAGEVIPAGRGGTVVGDCAFHANDAVDQRGVFSARPVMVGDGT